MENMENIENIEKTVIPETKPVRIMSIDALRGFDMFWIAGGGAVFASLNRAVDNPTTQWIKTQLSHVRWEGFRFEDLIMPLFLFITGVVIPYSFAKRISKGQGKARIYTHVIIRVIILWILGMIKQGNLLSLDPDQFKLYSNTLQAIAAGYLITSIVYLELKPKFQAVTFTVLLLLFWALMAFVPAGENGAGQLTESGNLAIYIDHAILGDFQDGTTYSWILSSMTFGCTVMLGCFAGQLLKSDKSELFKVSGLILAGVNAIIIGWIWGMIFPIIKHIWTSSFVLFSGGMCLLLLGIFYLVIDVWKIKKPALFFSIIGSNAIFIYMATSFISFHYTADKLFGGLYKYIGNWDNFTRNLAAFMLAWLLLVIMYRKKIFIKI